LQISDLHVDMHPDATRAVVDQVQDISYDLCVLTGDYRAKTFGSYAATLEGMKDVRRRLRGPLYGILGNHDTIRLVPELEDMGIRMLLNESVVIQRGSSALYFAGIDDAHHYRLHNIEKAAADIPADGVSILLSHTPEPYRQAAHAGFKVMLSGHTHGGQICLPGGYPILWDAACPRALVAGRWRSREMVGYTSVGAGTSVISARLNCPPEVTLHRLRVRA
jgi:predicted MPP superfamily phosphohydrolase